MESSELDEWYEEQKQLILEHYENELKLKKNKEKSKHNYQDKMKKLHGKYNTLHIKLIKKKLRKKRLRQFIDKKSAKIRKKYNKIKEFFEFRFQKEKKEE
ncbi:hypothetical protein JXB41_02600 [Candidatus Woesearchaeota archaeon]|nr:hypothetical protein [Candidatus Woesearchaeota archaeon]